MGQANLTGRREFLTLSLAAASIGVAGVAKAQTPERFWADLRSGKAFVLLRHAVAPGTGDPPDFRIDDCSTQRNLSDEGRDQSRAIGDLFRANRITSATVYSSRWCRCLDTARLLGLGEVMPLELLNSFFNERSVGQAQSADLLAWLGKQDFHGPAVFVTHQVNITGLTGEVPGSGEMIVTRINADGAVEVVDRVSPPF